MKEDDFYQKTRGNMVFSVYMRRRYKYDTALPGKKTKMSLPPKNTPKGDISRITEKDDIYPRKYSISAEIPRWLTQEAATGDVLQEKVFLEILQNSQEKTCARASFSIKLQVWGLQLY